MEKTKKRWEYEWCKICRINQNQGRRHNYFPRHINSLSSLFSRFLDKLSSLNSALSNPNFNSPDQTSSFSRFWCIFCEFDIDNVDSSFTCGNVIKHLASEDHLKNVKQFLWKYGSGTHKVDSFRVKEAEFAEWEKKCEVLRCKTATPSGTHQGSLRGNPNDIQLTNGILNIFNQNNIHFNESNLSKNVLPLQYNTNKNYQVCHSDISGAGKVGPSNQHLGLPMPQGSGHGLNTWSSTLTDYGSVHPLPSSSTNLFADGPADKGVRNDRSTTNMDPSLNGYQNLTRIYYEKSGDEKGNVYSGAPPPWLEGTEPASEIEQSTIARSNIAQKNFKKTSKLNPKRVGAAWAEKRRKELEMEKRGMIVANTSALDWLPNFGRVWESGSRKESMKEFKKVKVNVPKADREPEAEIRLQPYISKRTWLGKNTFSPGGFQEAGETS